MSLFRPWLCQNGHNQHDMMESFNPDSRHFMQEKIFGQCILVRSEPFETHHFPSL